MSLLYPAAPAQVSASITEPTPAFRRKVSQVIAAIVFFIAVYCILVLLSLALMLGCVLLGMSIFLLKPSIWTLLIGGGAVFMGGMIFFFLFKFLFAQTESEQPPGILLQESDEPRLFEFIRRVAAEVGTHFPKKIYLTADVNASVFYDSGFWSLFLPVRKNLNLGLGLVNALNVSELKSVLAHEFGHFSQRSMRLGTYVYYLNQLIYNLLYKNKGWGVALNHIASIHFILTFFAQLAVYMVQGVQWILQKMYAFVNRLFLGLSREMEFHADSIAASVAGSNNMAQALRQVSLGNLTYQHTLQKCNEFLSDDKVTPNFYAWQQTMALHLARINRLPLQNGLPVVTSDFVNSRQLGRIVYKDQWATHPTDAERAAHLEALRLPAELLDAPAWGLFQDPARWQEAFTNFLYREVEKKPTHQAVDETAFAQRLAEEKSKWQLPEVFKDYYDGHYVAETDLDAVAETVQAAPLDLKAVDALFRKNPDSAANALQRDIFVLENIENGRIDTKSFDFDGQKHRDSEAGKIRLVLQQELDDLLAERAHRDVEALRVFYAAALAAQGAAAGDGLLKHYRELYAAARLDQKFDATAREIFAAVHYFRMRGFDAQSDEATQYFKQLVDYEEPTLREIIADLLPEPWLEASLREKMEKFLAGKPNYLLYGNAHPANLTGLETLTGETSASVKALYFSRLRAVTEAQAALI